MEQGQRISHGALLSESPVGGTRLGYLLLRIIPLKILWAPHNVEGKLVIS